MEEIFKNRIDLSPLHENVSRIKSEISKVIIGQDQLLELLLTAILAKGHVLIEGVPGVAKTLTSKLLAKAIDSQFSRIQFTPDLMPSDVIGTAIFNPKTTAFEFRKGPIFSNLILIDEINRAPAKTQAALFEVMEERQITSDGVTYQLDEPYMVLATQNPIEQEGTYRLPEAQLDRFLFKIVVGYPGLEEEKKILQLNLLNDLRSQMVHIQKVLNADQIQACRDLVKQVHVEDKIISYIAEIAQETRTNPSLFLGCSPRASVALLNASRALAAIRGRDFVTPEDIRTLAMPLFCHRLILTPEKEMEGQRIEDVIMQIVNKIEVPR